MNIFKINSFKTLDRNGKTQVDPRGQSQEIDSKKGHYDIESS